MKTVEIYSIFINTRELHNIPALPCIQTQTVEPPAKSRTSKWYLGQYFRTFLEKVGSLFSFTFIVNSSKTKFFKKEKCFKVVEYCKSKE